MNDRDEIVREVEAKVRKVIYDVAVNLMENGKALREMCPDDHEGRLREWAGLLMSEAAQILNFQDQERAFDEIVRRVSELADQPIDMPKVAPIDSHDEELIKKCALAMCDRCRDGKSRDGSFHDGDTDFTDGLIDCTASPLWKMMESA